MFKNIYNLYYQNGKNMYLNFFVGLPIFEHDCCICIHVHVMGLRLLSYQKNMWLRMMCCLQIIWQENRKV